MSSHGINYEMSLLVLQLAVIIFTACFSGVLFRKLHLPPVIGELCAGILIGPYLLGSIPIPGLPHGLFPIPIGSVIPVHNELYGLAALASVLLLFNAGLETDLSMLMKFSVAGLTVGLGGVIVSFLAGTLVTSRILGEPFSAPVCLFMGTICTATSVGITTRILHDVKKVESPEGIMILAGAVIDDIIGIAVLAVVVGIASARSLNLPGGVSWTHIGLITGKAFVVWIGFTGLGLLAAPYIGAFLKWFKSITVFSVLAMAIGFVAAAVFERSGLAMIVGAYSAGLALSRTDIRYVIVERLHPLHVFLVPVFFVIMGMFVNMRYVLSMQTLWFGAAFTIAAVAAKLVGCGAPALLFNFNRLGALRIGVGMAPRSEVALIIAGVGLTSGVLDDATFGATAMMVLFSALLAPPILERLMKNPASGVRRRSAESENVAITYTYPSTDTADFVVLEVLEYFTKEGFFVHAMLTESRIYRLNRNSMSVVLHQQAATLVLETARDDVVFVKTLVYEALLNMHETIGRLKHLAKPESMRAEISQGDRKSTGIIADLVDRSCLQPALKGTGKRQIIEELIDILVSSGKLKDRRTALGDVLDREESMSTGMQYGVALPHAKTSAVAQMCVAVGISRDGVEFGSLDGIPSRLFIMALSPEHTSGPHIQFLAGISSLLSSQEARERLQGCATADEMFEFLTADAVRTWAT